MKKLTRNLILGGSAATAAAGGATGAALALKKKNGNDIDASELEKKEQQAREAAQALQKAHDSALNQKISQSAATTFVNPEQGRTDTSVAAEDRAKTELAAQLASAVNKQANGIPSSEEQAREAIVQLNKIHQDLIVNAFEEAKAADSQREAYESSHAARQALIEIESKIKAEVAKANAEYHAKLAAQLVEQVNKAANGLPAAQEVEAELLRQEAADNARELAKTRFVAEDAARDLAAQQVEDLIDQNKHEQHVADINAEITGENATELASQVNKHGNELATELGIAESNAATATRLASQVNKAANGLPSSEDQIKAGIEEINRIHQDLIANAFEEQKAADSQREAYESSHAARQALIEIESKIKAEVAKANAVFAKEVKKAAVEAKRLNDQITRSANVTFVNPEQGRTDTSVAAEDRAKAEYLADLDAAIHGAVQKHLDEMAKHFVIVDNPIFNTEDGRTDNSAEVAANAKAAAEADLDVAIHAALQQHQNVLDKHYAIIDNPIFNTESGRVDTSAETAERARADAIDDLNNAIHGAIQDYHDELDRHFAAIDNPIFNPEEGRNDASAKAAEAAARAASLAEMDATIHAAIQQHQNELDKHYAMIDNPIFNNEQGRTQSARVENTARENTLIQERLKIDLDKRDAEDAVLHSLAQTRANELDKNHAIIDNPIFNPEQGRTDTSIAAENVAKAEQAAIARSFLDAERQVLHVNKQGNAAMTQGSIAFEDNTARHASYSADLEKDNAARYGADQEREQKSAYEAQRQVDEFNKQLAEQRIEEQAKFEAERQAAYEIESQRERSVINDDLNRRAALAQHAAVVENIHREDASRNITQSQIDKMIEEAKAQQVAELVAGVNKSGNVDMSKEQQAEDAYKAFLEENQKQTEESEGRSTTINADLISKEVESHLAQVAAEASERTAHDKYVQFIEERKAYENEINKIAQQELDAQAREENEFAGKTLEELSTSYTDHTAEVARMQQEAEIIRQRQIHQNELNDQQKRLVAYVAANYNGEIRTPLPTGIKMETWFEVNKDNNFGGVQIPETLKNFIFNTLKVDSLNVMVQRLSDNHYRITSRVDGSEYRNQAGQTDYAILNIDSSPVLSSHQSYGSHQTQTNHNTPAQKATFSWNNSTDNMAEYVLSVIAEKLNGSHSEAALHNAVKFVGDIFTHSSLQNQSYTMKNTEQLSVAFRGIDDHRVIAEFQSIIGSIKNELGQRARMGSISEQVKNERNELLEQLNNKIQELIQKF